MTWRAIIADDEEKILQLILMLGHWDQYGIEIIDRCTNGREALDSILKNRPDFVISDIKMPEVDGLQLIEETRKAGGELVPASARNNLQAALSHEAQQ